jgi:hypothetical protein
LVASGLGLALLQVLYLLLYVCRSAPILNDFVFDLLMLIKKFAEFATSLSHDVEKRLGDDALVAYGPIPNDGSDTFWYAFRPKLSAL